MARKPSESQQRRNNAAQASNMHDSGRRLARDLKPGEVWRWGADGNPVRIKSINELCVHQPQPHVHLIIEGGEPKCLPFTKAV